MRLLLLLHLLLGLRRPKIGGKGVSSSLLLPLTAASSKGVPSTVVVVGCRWRGGGSIIKSPKQIHHGRCFLLFGRNVRHCGFAKLSRNAASFRGRSSTTILRVPRLVLVLAQYPGPQQALIAVVDGLLQALRRGRVARHPHFIDLIVVGRLQLRRLLGSKAAVSHALDAVSQFAVNAGTGQAHETAGGEIDRVGQFGAAVAALFVGRQFRLLADQIVRTFRLLAAVGSVRACVTATLARGSQHVVSKEK